MRGLPIRQPYIDMILDGHKTWEMRSRRCLLRERIALIQSKSQTIVGVADLVDCIGPMTDDERLAAMHKHCVNSDTWLDPKMVKYRFAWVLANVQKLPKPVPYSHRFGAALWVSINDSVMQEVAALLSSSK